MTTPGERLSNLSDIAEAMQVLANICGLRTPGNATDFEDFLKEIKKFSAEWSSDQRSYKISLLLQHRKSVLVTIASNLGLKRSGTKASLAESIISRLSVTRRHQVEPKSSFVSLPNPSNALPSVRVVCGEVLYLHKKTESTGIVFGEVEKRIMSHPFTEIENQFMRVLGPPWNDGKGLAWFSSVALEIGTKSVPVYFTVPVHWKDASVILRCLRVDLSMPLHMWKNEWPFPVIAQVNGYQTKLKTATRYTNGKIFGVDGATDISEHIRKDNSSNKVVLYRPTVSDTSSAAKVEYVVFAQPVYIYSDDDIINSISLNSWSRFQQRMQRMGNVSSAFLTKPMSQLEWFQLYIVNYMASEELELEQFQVSLRCPLSLVPLKLPALSIFCKHLQCFDLKAFLAFTRNNLRFLCPICSIHVCWDELLICPFTSNILSNYRDAKALTIFPDGSFQVVKEETEEQVATSDTSAAPYHHPLPSSNFAHSCSSNSIMDKSMQVIDLSDDDEE